ncbi:TAP-like protein-domain-containing protein [Lophiotrema nucula]|uniref:TAP-like protein-domain-containing protein n=1 Tax=Lophiotrema nucula TaxID=690887 RepID=A0A6A5YQ46_9PLEO|nr:TAP-like protein-domain-containing protein [Lophiotrema nucula]
MIYDFADLSPTSDLVWTPCFDNFTCALLELPLDYSDTEAGTTAVAFIKKSSTNPDAEDVLFNPGGPGGSGVDLILSSSDVAEAKLGPNFNLVSWDPRGVNNSGPNLSCFPDSPIGQNIFDSEVFVAVDNSTEFSLAESYQRSGMFGQWCTPVLGANSTVKYANTVATAQDMLRYVELRAKSLGRPPAEAKLWYYGISYGTVLGATFATLFPDRIGRIILDVVVDTEDYYVGGWSTAVYGTDASARYFFRSCFEAGPELCAFHQNATSPEELEQRYFAIVESLKESPIAVADPSFGSSFLPTLVTWQDLSTLFFSLLYFPVPYYPLIDLGLTYLEQGNATYIGLATIKAQLLVPQPYSSAEPRTIISCLDAAGRFNVTDYDKYEAYIGGMFNRSFYGAPTISAIVGAPCRSLDIAPPTSQIFEGKPGANKTSAPILFIGNTLDPVTPLRSAKKVASTFAGSSVLTLDAAGHTSIGMASDCVDQSIKAYMNNLTLPAANTICKPDQIPFVNQASEGAARLAKRSFPAM